jgi:predicted AAA+ superfamily ATPase
LKIGHDATILRPVLPRGLTPILQQALAERPVVFLDGARQVGKSTLARSGATGDRRYLTLDEASVLQAAAADPAGFIAGLDGPVVIDEVQRAPDLFLAIKAAVDRDRRPGRFLLTGSADVLLLPGLARTLTGRTEILTLWPLSQGEISGAIESFVDAAFGDRLPQPPRAPTPGIDLAQRITRGGFPELVAGTVARRSAWFESYLTTLLQRDVRDASSIEGLAALPRLLALIASRPMGLLNYADLSRTSGVPQTTLKRYIVLLEMTFLVQMLPAWFVNLGKRLAKAPKVLLADPGLAAHLQGADASRLRADRNLLGPLLENFVVMEVKKQVTWSRIRPKLFHFRTSEGAEVDLVLEETGGRVLGIEVKAASTIRPADLKGMRTLAEAAGSRFHRGLVLYTGEEVVPLAGNVHALPVSALWEWTADPTPDRSPRPAAAGR